MSFKLMMVKFLSGSFLSEGRFLIANNMNGPCMIKTGNISKTCYSVDPITFPMPCTPPPQTVHSMAAHGLDSTNALFHVDV